MNYCAECGAALQGGAFCSACGTPAVTRPMVVQPTGGPPPPMPAPGTPAPGTPAPPWQPPVVPFATTGRPPAQPPQIDLSWLLRGNWVAAAATALVVVVLAFGASAGLIWLTDPPETSTEDRLTLTAVSAAASVSADAVGRIVWDSDGSSGEFTANAGIVPLTITLLSLGVAVLLFRRLTAGYGRVGFALADAARAALIHAVLTTVLVVIFRSSDSELTAVAQESMGGDEATFGASIPTTFFLSLLVVFSVLALSCLLRRDWLSARGQRLHGFIAAPVSGLAAYVALLPVAGLIGWTALWFTGDMNETENEELGAGRTVALWLYTLANAGQWFIHAGAGGRLGGSYDMSDMDEGKSAEFHRLARGVEETEAWGLWFAIPTMLIVLAVCAVIVVLRSTHTHPGRNLLIWAVSLVAVLPGLSRLVSLHGSADGTFSYGGDDESLSMEGMVGVKPVDSLLLPLIALAVALLVGALMGVLDVRGTAARLQQNPSQARPQGGPQQPLQGPEHPNRAFDVGTRNPQVGD